MSTPDGTGWSKAFDSNSGWHTLYDTGGFGRLAAIVKPHVVGWLTGPDEPSIIPLSFTPGGLVTPPDETDAFDPNSVPDDTGGFGRLAAIVKQHVVGWDEHSIIPLSFTPGGLVSTPGWPKAFDPNSGGRTPDDTGGFGRLAAIVKPHVVGCLTGPDESSVIPKPSPPPKAPGWLLERPL